MAPLQALLDALPERTGWIWSLAALADVGIDRRSGGNPAGTKSGRRRGMGSTRDDAGRFGGPRSGTDPVPPRRTAACIGNGSRTRKSAPESLPDASRGRAPEGFGADPGHEPRPLGLVRRIRGAPRGMDRAPPCGFRWRPSARGRLRLGPCPCADGAAKGRAGSPRTELNPTLPPRRRGTGLATGGHETTSLRKATSASET